MKLNDRKYNHLHFDSDRLDHLKIVEQHFHNYIKQDVEEYDIVYSISITYCYKGKKS